ncbi:S-layer homology domain-containing protein [Anaerobacillus sp. HL2]|nr:S-layer homology domain-containing protein [Anaerobacillus sp. HL2]
MKNTGHYNAIQQLTTNGIASGFSDNTYRPKQEVTRAEFSVFLFRALHNK